MFTSSGESKSRTVPGPDVSIKTEVILANGNHIPLYNVVGPTGGIQITESDGNRWPPPKGGPITDFGSEFYTQKTEVLPFRFPHSSLRFIAKPSNSLSVDWLVDGRFMIANAWGTNGQSFADTEGKKQYLIPSFPDLSSTRGQLEVKGAIAVAACAPGNPIAAASSSIGELMQDIPAIPGVALWKSRLRAAETVAASGDEFLNGIFGILPTVSDMQTFIEGVHKVDKLVDQFERDSGRVVRRKFSFPKERTIEETVLTGVYSPLGNSQSGSNNLYPTAARCLPTYETIRTRVVEREIWFSGAFTYYLPSWYETGDRRSRMRLTAQLLGAKPDIGTLWQLTPWSWAIDWVVSGNSYVKNLASALNYSTVMRYGYVMEKTTVTDTYSAGKVVVQPDPTLVTAFPPPYPRPSPVQLRVTTKKRIQANPFGFGVSWDGLSTVQRAIVAALGITRVVR